MACVLVSCLVLIVEMENVIPAPITPSTTKLKKKQQQLLHQYNLEGNFNQHFQVH